MTIPTLLLVLFLSFPLGLIQSQQPSTTNGNAIAHLIHVRQHGRTFILHSNDPVDAEYADKAPIQVKRFSYLNEGFCTWNTELEIINLDSGRTITNIEWEVDTYYRTSRVHGGHYFQESNTKIKPNKKAKVRDKISTCVGNDILVLAQLRKITFDDGFVWSSSIDCKPSSDLKSLACASR
jgi:hypothetical protein